MTMRGKHFQITGLPRSGTAFLSVLFSLEPDCLGVHELAAEDPHWRETLEKLLKKHRYVADCCTYGYTRGAQDPESIRVYIRKDPEQSRLRCKERFGYDIDAEAFQTLRNYADRWAKEKGALQVSYEQLFDLDVLAQIWDHCFDGERLFPEEKASRLVTMNIQRQNPEKVFTIANGMRLAEEVL